MPKPLNLTLAGLPQGFELEVGLLGTLYTNWSLPARKFWPLLIVHQKGQSISPITQGGQIVLPILSRLDKHICIRK